MAKMFVRRTYLSLMAGSLGVLASLLFVAHFSDNLWANRENASRSRPSLESQFTRIEHDFGVVRPNSTVSHRFAVKNQSQAVWHIMKVRSTCSCTVTKAESNFIRPGDSGDFVVEYKAPPKRSNVRKTVLVLFKNPGVPPVALSVLAAVRSEFEIDPSIISITHRLDASGSPIERIAMIELDPSIGTTLMAKTNVPWLSAVVEKVGRDGSDKSFHRYRLIVRIDPAGFTVGLHCGLVTLSCYSNQQAFVELAKSIPIDINVESDVRASPPTLFFGGIGHIKYGQEEISVLLRFQSPDKVPAISQTTVSNSLGSLLTYDLESIDATTWKLQCRLDHSEFHGNSPVRGTLTLEFSSDLPKLVMPVYARIARN